MRVIKGGSHVLVMMMGAKGILSCLSKSFPSSLDAIIPYYVIPLAKKLQSLNILAGIVSEEGDIWGGRRGGVIYTHRCGR